MASYFYYRETSYSQKLNTSETELFPLQYVYVYSDKPTFGQITLVTSHSEGDVLKYKHKHKLLVPYL